MINPTIDLINSRFGAYRSIYRSSTLMGASRILNNALALPADTPTPLSLSHGIDFGHCYVPQDIDCIEPAHWAYNRDIFEEAIKIKPAVLLPHPWALVCSNLPTLCAGDRTLVIGPPPGKDNDRRLLQLLKLKCREDNMDILIKHRGGIKESTDFFSRHLIGTVSAGATDDGFYYRLHTTLSKYSKIIACTFSSAALFAASIGKRIEFLEGYHYDYYAPPDISKTVNYKSLRAKAFVNAFIGADHDTRTKLARDLLGFDLVPNTEALKNAYISTILNLKAPFHSRRDMNYLRGAAIRAGALLAIPSIAKLGAGIQQVRLLETKVSAIIANELSIWVDGPSETNYIETTQKYVRGITIPGSAVVKYT